MNARINAVESEFDAWDAARTRGQRLQEQADAMYPIREEAIRHDLETLSEAFQDLDCLDWRRERDWHKADGSLAYSRKRITTGQAALLAFNSGDALEFFRLVKAEVDARIAERARDEIDAELDL